MHFNNEWSFLLLVSEDTSFIPSSTLQSDFFLLLFFFIVDVVEPKSHFETSSGLIFVFPSPPTRRTSGLELLPETQTSLARLRIFWWLHTWPSIVYTTVNILPWPPTHHACPAKFFVVVVNINIYHMGDVDLCISHVSNLKCMWLTSLKGRQQVWYGDVSRQIE